MENCRECAILDTYVPLVSEAERVYSASKLSEKIQKQRISRHCRNSYGVNASSTLPGMPPNRE